jgi:hypothetical protein
MSYDSAAELSMLNSLFTGLTGRSNVLVLSGTSSSFCVAYFARRAKYATKNKMARTMLPQAK